MTRVEEMERKTKRRHTLNLACRSLGKYGENRPVSAFVDKRFRHRIAIINKIVTAFQDFKLGVVILAVSNPHLGTFSMPIAVD